MNELLTLRPEELDEWIGCQDHESTNWETVRYLLTCRIGDETSLASVLLLLRAADAAALLVGEFHSDADRFRLRANVIRRFGPDRNDVLRSPGAIMEWFAQLSHGQNPPEAPIVATAANLELIRTFRSIIQAAVILSLIQDSLTPEELGIVDPWIDSAGSLS